MCDKPRASAQEAKGSVVQLLQAYHSVVKDLPQIIVQMICVIIVRLQQTTKVIKIGGIHENSLHIIQERLFQIDCKITSKTHLQ